MSPFPCWAKRMRHRVNENKRRESYCKGYVPSNIKLGHYGLMEDREQQLRPSLNKTSQVSAMQVPSIGTERQPSPIITWSPLKKKWYSWIVQYFHEKDSTYKTRLLSFILRKVLNFLWTFHISASLVDFRQFQMLYTSLYTVITVSKTSDSKTTVTTTEYRGRR